MTAFIARTELAAMVGIVLAIVSLLACRRSESPDQDFTRVTDDLRARVVPADATPVGAPRRTVGQFGVAKAVWELELASDWSAYRSWLIEQLGEFACVGRDAATDDEQIAFVRTISSRNEMWTVVAQREIEADAHRVHVEFTITPN